MQRCLQGCNQDGVADVINVGATNTNYDWLGSYIVFDVEYLFNGSVKND